MTGKVTVAAHLFVCIFSHLQAEAEIFLHSKLNELSYAPVHFKLWCIAKR